ncbi:DNA glycosylase [Dichomitus squalens]|uniref:DNA glycosylase n=1 Tax=Dichomitus squalens TaxID=114155 RepID=A0A4Q9MKP2_9APHY|nr:DNA glycosylase [Dichomitus squalens]
MPPKLKRPRSITPTIPQRGDATTAEPPSPQTPSHRAKKLKLLASHAISSPFPDFPHPTPAEAEQVHALLATTHPDIASSSARRSKPSDDSSSNSARTCGKVSNVLDSLIGTILSQNTSSRNSTAAKHGLDAAFGRHNFQAIAEASKDQVVEAIKTGGLANKKAAVIQTILREVYDRHGEYSLQHLARVVQSDVDVNSKAKAEGSSQGRAAVSDEEAMQELVSYDGVGPKTASCVLLFCLGRSSFPVDTHVFRLSRLLGWVPARADRVTAQAHLDLKVPDHLKYGLHVLMVGHGRRCKGCKSMSSGKGECVLKRWVQEQKGAKEEEMEETIVKAEEAAAEVAVDHSTDVKSEVS